MAAILGLDDAQVLEVCERAAEGGVVEAVNFNSPGQVVIAGDTAAVDRAVALAAEAGARRSVKLPVSVPSHCRLMEAAASRLADRLADVTVTAPAIPVIHNVDASAHDAADEIRAALAAQLHRPVRWVGQCAPHGCAGRRPP
jgi:[acyl-carrier-protein] S-malonyltransferase